MYGEDLGPSEKTRNNKSLQVTQEGGMTDAEKAQKAHDEEVERLRKAYYDDEDGFEFRISSDMKLNQSQPSSGRRLSKLPKERQEAI